MAAFIRAMISGGVFAGASRPHHDTASNPATPSSLTVGVSGSCAMRFSRGDRERPQRAGFDVRREQRDRSDGDRHVAGDRVVHQRPAALVGHMRHRHAQRVADLASWRAARGCPRRSCRRATASAWPWPRRSRRRSFCTRWLVRGDDHRRGADQHDRREVLQRVERQIGQQARIGAVGVEHQHEGGAVRRRQ